jgi:hypothetical protein
MSAQTITETPRESGHSPDGVFWGSRHVGLATDALQLFTHVASGSPA